MSERDSTSPTLPGGGPDPVQPHLRAVDATAAGLYLIVVLSWGFSWIGLKAQLGIVAPEVSLLWRMSLAAIGMGIIVAIRRETMRYGLVEHLHFLAIGALMFSFNFVLFYYAGLTLPSGLMAVVFSLTSIVNLLLAALILRQPISRRVAAGGIIGSTGIVMLYLPQIGGAGFDFAALIGLLLCVAGTIAFCLGNIAATGLQRRRIGLFAANCWGMIYAAVLLFLASALQGHAFIIEPTPAYIGSLLFLATISSVLAFSAYIALLRRIGPARAGYATVMFPLLALSISTVAEGYTWTLLAAIGAATALAGNLIVLTGRPGR